jgi:endonuclease YncB( thermonuclease family)
MFIIRVCVFNLLLLFVSLPVGAKTPIRTLQGQVIKVTDGDTITVDSNSTKVKVRLYGIDAPETEKVNHRNGRVNKPGQPYGEEAYNALLAKVGGKQVRLDIFDFDRYRRAVSIVWLGNRNINREVVAEGWAWAYRQYLDRPYKSEFMEAEEMARKERRGLWEQNNPQPPWDFRKQLRINH